MTSTRVPGSHMGPPRAILAYRSGLEGFGGIRSSVKDELQTSALLTIQTASAETVEGNWDCHGAPGAKWAKFSEGLHPDPPDLKEVTDTPPEQLFWVIKNGINMTGMPSFSAAGAKDEDIWAIVAYIKKIPGISEADYKAWTAPKQ